jgi:uncharacterized protein involved in type VI secretion and phage assembly
MEIISDVSRLNGVVIAKVVKVEGDPGVGQVRLHFPWMGENSQTRPVPVATLMSGGDRGMWFMPEEGDEVLVAFNQGDVNDPYIIGFLWNGQQKPPTSDPHKRMIRSVNGHEIILYDPPDTSSGDKGYISIRDNNGNEIKLQNAQITITSIAAVVIKAPTVTINGRPVLPAAAPI